MKNYEKKSDNKYGHEEEKQKTFRAAPRLVGKYETQNLFHTT